MPRAVLPINQDLDFQYNNRLQNFLADPRPTDPSAAEILLAGAGGLFWLNTTEGKLKYTVGTDVRVIGSESGRDRGSFDASGGVTPVAADATVDPGTAIKRGDSFLISVAGTLTGIFGEDAVEVGDVLVSQADAPASAADWYSLQANIEPKTTLTLSEEFAGIDLVAETNLDVTPTNFTKVTSCEIFSATGQDLSYSIGITRATDGSKVTLLSNNDLTGLLVILHGNS